MMQENPDYTTSVLPEIAGFSYVPDPAAYRIRCDTCGATAGSLGISPDYAHGWLDAWAYNHLEECRIMDCNHARSVTLDPSTGAKKCNDCGTPLPLTLPEQQSIKFNDITERLKKLQSAARYLAASVGFRPDLKSAFGSEVVIVLRDRFDALVEVIDA